VGVDLRGYWSGAVDRQEPAPALSFDGPRRDKGGQLMIAQNVETYCDGGVWKNRRPGCEPFSSGGSKLRQLTIGAEVARWAQTQHVIRDETGVIIETNIYASGPLPPRSPIKTIRPPAEG
jgi:hypothetical protein